MTDSASHDLPTDLISRYSRIGAGHSNDTLFTTEHGVSPQEYQTALASNQERLGRPHSLYVHLPFCPVQCLNCDNNAVITHDSTQIDTYLDNLERELGLLTHEVKVNNPLQQVSIGGGSPNYLNDRQLVRLMVLLGEHFVLGDDTEFSLNANPKRSSLNQLALLNSLGFERINFSIPELDPRVQLAIGRTTSSEMVRDVIDTARDVGFKTISVDVMYGLPCQTEDGIKRSMDSLMTLAPDRIACFAFTRHAAKRAHQAAIDKCTMPSLADKLSLFNTMVQQLSAEYKWIGLDNFAKPEDALSKAQSEKRLHRTWLGYSHLPPTDMFGIGTNAITDLKDICVQNHLGLDSWQTQIDQGELPIRGGVRLSEAQRRQRDAIRNLMCNMEIEDYSALINGDSKMEATWNGFAQDGLLSITSQSMSLTPQGRYLLPHLLTSPTT